MSDGVTMLGFTPRAGRSTAPGSPRSFGGKVRGGVPSCCERLSISIPVLDEAFLTVVLRPTGPPHGATSQDYSEFFFPFAACERLEQRVAHLACHGKRCGYGFTRGDSEPYIL